MSESEKFPIVGIGASAGGVEALEGFFRGLPPDPGIAVVVVTHLSPERESLMHEIVGRYTRLPVQFAVDGVEVEVNTVYVLPSDAVLGIEQRHLSVHRQASRRERKPIDIFFTALAIDLGEMAAGVVLSGGDSDGTLGIKAIKEHGGLTLAQVSDGYGPQHPDMPAAAISTGLVDFAVPVEEMGRILVEFANGTPLAERIVADPQAIEAQPIEQIMPDIYGILRNQIGHDFSGYKTKTFVRRVQRRMQVTHLDTVEAYVERLRQEPQEVAALFRDLLISVTNFFRDAEAFDSLANLVVPKLFEKRGADDMVRVWVPGCSTGEEVFSVAILMREHMDTLSSVPRVQIFATDIDDRALSVGRGARYPAGLLDSVSPQRRGRFFVADGGSYVVSKEIREMCVFSPHSVIRDPPFSRIDLISCRNLLIYFGADVQNQVIPTFHYALRPDGYLFLGSAENVSQFEDLLIPIDKKHRIFRRRSDVPSTVRLPLPAGTWGLGHAGEHPARRQPLPFIALRQAVDDQVLARFAPPQVVVSRDGDIVYYSTRTGKYFEAPPGAPSRQLFAVARKGLRLDLRAVFREAVETGSMAVRENVAVEGESGSVQVVTLIVEPMADRAAGEPLYLVLFADRGSALSREEALGRAQAAYDGSAVHNDRELRETRDRLQATVEEYESALEELKSSNEELVSVNEEMQSTNEELEASKEELQSLNEELHTVNAELLSKVDALDRANSDLQNLFESTNVATVFLDRNLVIRSFTPAVAHIFNILPGDRGRPITDLASRLVMTGLAEDIAKVCAGGGPIERRVETADHAAHYLVGLAPYRDGGMQIDGVVVTFVDVTSLTRSEARQRLLIAELQHRTRNLLTVVQSIARQTVGRGGPVNSFLTRLAALGRVQGLIGGTMDDQIDLGEIVRLELQAVSGATDGKVTIAGPRVVLGFEPVQTLGLALHELATNAIKHGALKAPDGHLDIAWQVSRDSQGAETLILDWRESGVPDMPKPGHRGFGRELIEQALAFTLHAKTSLTFGPDGLSCHIELPLAKQPAG